MDGALSRHEDPRDQRLIAQHFGELFLYANMHPSDFAMSMHKFAERLDVPPNLNPASDELYSSWVMFSPKPERRDIVRMSGAPKLA